MERSPHTYRQFSPLTDTYASKNVSWSFVENGHWNFHSEGNKDCLEHIYEEMMWWLMTIIYMNICLYRKSSTMLINLNHPKKIIKLNAMKIYITRGKSWENLILIYIYFEMTVLWKAFNVKIYTFKHLHYHYIL